jgi:hypothetical protein
MLAWCGLVALVVLSRVWVAPDVLYEWDSANYALALGGFDVFEHQPHPPGSPLLVGALWVARYVTDGGAVTAFLLVNVLASIAAVIALADIVRDTAGRWPAFVTGAAFAACPPFWIQGAVSTAYGTECACSVVVAALALRTATGRLRPEVCLLALGVLAGIRPSGLLLWGPVALVGVAMSRPSGAAVVRSTAALVTGTIVWAAPLLISQGPDWFTANAAMGEWQLRSGSLFGGDLMAVRRHAELLAVYLLDAGNLLWGPLLLMGFGLVWKGEVHRPTVAFFAAWLMPGVLVYTLHHLPKSAYALTLIPGIFAATAVLWAWARHQFSAWAGWLDRVGVAIAGTYIAFNGVAFVAAVPSELVERRDAPIEGLPSMVLLRGDYGRWALAYDTWPQTRLRDVIADIDPEQDLVVYLFGAHELYRIQSVYSPTQWTVLTSAEHGIALQHSGAIKGFGAFQQQVLRDPRLESTWREQTRVDLVGSELSVARGEALVRVPLGRTPRRLLVVSPCPPCSVRPGEGIELLTPPAIGGGFKLSELAIDAHFQAPGKHNRTRGVVIP